MKDSMNILFLGDVMLGENVYHLGRGIRTKYGDHFPNLIPEDIKQVLLNDVDAVFYNFEYSLAPEEFDFKDFEQSIYASTVSSLGVFPDNVLKIVNIANNHFWERGDERTKFTINTLKKEGFVVVGETNAPVTIELKNKRLVIYGCSLKDWNVPVFTSTYEKLIDDIVIPEFKNDNDIWIMSIHWGNEFISYPDREQVELAHRLIERGFDIVHGHHPHVFQPVEKFENGLIMYSMGNFLFDENFARETQKSYCIKVDLCNKYLFDCLLMRNRHYKPYKIEVVNSSKVLLSPNKYWSVRKKQFVFKLYNTFRKLEYLPHLMDNNCLIYKSMKKRKNK